jgi:hypothetical protein
MRSVSRIPSKTGGKVRLDDGKFGKFSVRLDFGELFGKLGDDGLRKAAYRGW